MTTETKRPSDMVWEITRPLFERGMAVVRKSLEPVVSITSSWDVYLASAEGKAIEEQVTINAIALAMPQYLDAEADRRAKFEQDITERVWALETGSPGAAGSISEVPCECGFVAKIAHLRIDTAAVREKTKLAALAAHNCPLRDQPHAPVGVYEGDGHPAARASYEVGAEGSEEL